MQPKAVVLYGKSAANGKSTILKLFRAFLPKEACASLTPAQMGDKFYRIGLAGKLLNATDELGRAAIESDVFKMIVTGDETTARQLREAAFQFKPRAQHVLAANDLPIFNEGMDRGVLRRLTVVEFKRTIPEPERIPAIERLIIEREAGIVLA